MQLGCARLWHLLTARRVKAGAQRWGGKEGRNKTTLPSLFGD